MCVCNCMYMDMLGNWIEDDMPIFTTDKWLMENVRDIEIDYIHGHRVVKFSSNRRISDGNGGTLRCLIPMITINHYIFLKSFVGSHFERYFLS